MATQEGKTVLISRNKQTNLVKDSLETAFDELYAGKARKNARQLVKEIESKKGN